LLLVRNCFVAKPGQASKLAAQVKAAVSEIPRHRVLTDLTGEFNRVILEFEVENLVEFEARLQEYANDKVLREKLAGYTDHWMTGTRELLQIWS
jgi:hypothetical protein